jgi:hypothetical protein
MARQSGLTTGTGLLYLDETSQRQSGLPGLFVSETGATYAAAAGQADGVSSVIGASLAEHSAGQADGVSSVAGVSQLVTQRGAGQADGTASAVGASPIIGTGRADGTANVVATAPPSAAIGRADGASAVLGVPPAGLRRTAALAMAGI